MTNWKSMDSAPKNGKQFLSKDSDGNVYLTKYKKSKNIGNFWFTMTTKDIFDEKDHELVSWINIPKENNDIEDRIVSVAIKYRNVIISLPKPGRHHNIINMKVIPKGYEQGFLTSKGLFLNRIKAAKLALKTGQTKSLISPPWLTSEDLW